MLKTDQLIICVAPCGSFLTKEANPNIPITPAEIAEEVHRSWNEGASIAHIHARDKNGIGTTDPEVFSEIKQRIRDKNCDIIIEFSSSPGREANAKVEDGFRVLEAGPEMISVDIGVAVFMRKDKEKVALWTRSFVEKLVKTCLKKQIKPEFEIYGVGGITELDNLLEKITIPNPIWIDFVLDMQKTAQNVTPFTTKNLLHLVEQIPSEAMFMAMGVAASELKVAVQSILLGGHVRVGMEDNLFLKKGVMAKSNADLVAGVARIGSDLGRHIASPKEARKLLGLSAITL